MPHTLMLAAVQPPWPSAERSPDDVVAAALELTRTAIAHGAQLICLPEYLNTASLRPDAAGDWQRRGRHILTALAELAASSNAWLAVSLLMEDNGRRTNTAFLIGPDGPAGRYDKVHITRAEKHEWGITPGSTYLVFDLPFARVAMMICYDICFPEVARILAIQGAQVVLFPALQRSFTERHLELQMKSRAYDNFLWIVRSSYGTPPGEPWQPGIPVGKSCIAAPDGTLAADAGRFVGIALAPANLDAPEVGPMSHGAPPAVLRDVRFADRRPETYGHLTQQRAQ